MSYVSGTKSYQYWENGWQTNPPTKEFPGSTDDMHLTLPEPPKNPVFGQLKKELTSKNDEKKIFELENLEHGWTYSGQVRNGVPHARELKIKCIAIFEKLQI